MTYIFINNITQLKKLKELFLKAENIPKPTLSTEYPMITINSKGSAQYYLLSFACLVEMTRFFLNRNKIEEAEAFLSIGKLDAWFCGDGIEDALPYPENIPPFPENFVIKYKQTQEDLFENLLSLLIGGFPYLATELIKGYQHNNFPSELSNSDLYRLVDATLRAPLGANVLDANSVSSRKEQFKVILWIYKKIIASRHPFAEEALWIAFKNREKKLRENDDEYLLNRKRLPAMAFNSIIKAQGFYRVRLTVYIFELFKKYEAGKASAVAVLKFYSDPVRVQIHEWTAPLTSETLVAILNLALLMACKPAIEQLLEISNLKAWLTRGDKVIFRNVAGLQIIEPVTEEKLFKNLLSVLTSGQVILVELTFENYQKKISQLNANDLALLIEAVFYFKKRCDGSQDAVRLIARLFQEISKNTHATIILDGAIQQLQNSSEEPDLLESWLNILEEAKSGSIAHAEIAWANHCLNFQDKDNLYTDEDNPDINEESSALPMQKGSKKIKKPNTPTLFSPIRPQPQSNNKEVFFHSSTPT